MEPAENNGLEEGSASLVLERRDPSARRLRPSAAAQALSKPQSPSAWQAEGFGEAIDSDSRDQVPLPSVQMT